MLSTSAISAATAAKRRFRSELGGIPSLVGNAFAKYVLAIRRRGKWIPNSLRCEVYVSWYMYHTVSPFIISHQLQLHRFRSNLLDPRLCNGKVILVDLDPHEVTPLQHCRAARRAAAHHVVKNCLALISIGTN